ncbi:YhdH/YhfP family quinone oxidoreductase [Dyadobacter frigoris]|uniref:Acryloyl-CoA reductase n=1 Tax=Dyadobacter frigoris TaxID=2576211 RepID=A0A4U6D9F3_9BACT|nr:YhdH/YhfP family quinone oxidoreductase [Dyadobacter frigoris]TKT93011.1 acryloyl-CoA reductase [Dyadobacter frigoris]GLU55880.1 alcohol dehydrogenase [Dyadobacter frigoris]
MQKVFKALYISQEGGDFKKEIKELNTADLPGNDVLIKVSYSSLNYKDALSASGNKGVTRKFPHVPGIDAAGIVVKSNTSDFQEGDSVLVTGFDLGMNTWGGFGQYISVPAPWVVALPEGLSLKESMSFGTAGLTAGLSVEKIIGAGITQDLGAVIVSGATGGVGSMATAIMSKLGFEVVAISGKSEDDFLTSTLGAKQILNRNEFIEKYNNKPLSSSDFSAGIDNVGGPTLSGILKSVKQYGMVTCCGNVSSAELNTTIFPFILRGITLTGIDSAQAPIALRKKVWQSLASEWKPLHLNEMIREIGLEELPEKLDALLHGKAKGRYVLKHN